MSEENKNLEAAEINDDDLEGAAGGVSIGESLHLGWAIPLGLVTGYYPGRECPNSACNHEILTLLSETETEGETICPNCKQTWHFWYTA